MDADRHDQNGSTPAQAHSYISATRFAATAASILTLAAAVAPSQPITDATALPTTQIVTEATTVATTVPASMPTTIQVVVTDARPVRVEPTTQEFREAVRKGDLWTQIIEFFSDTGVTETVRRTEWWQWLGAFGSIALGFLLGRLSAKAFNNLGLRAATRVKLLRAVVFNSIAGPMSLFVITIGLAFGFFAVLKPSIAVQAILRPGFQLLHVFTVGWLLFNLVDLVTLAMSRLSRGRQGNLSVMLVPMTQRVLRVALIIMLLLFAANNILNWNIGALLAGLGIAGLAVSLAAQDTLRNLFGSVMIFADQPFALGDQVKVTDFEGKVEDIGFRSTRLRTADGYVVTIPNANIAGAAVLNYSRRKAIRRTLDVTLLPGTPIAKVQEALSIVRGVLASKELSDALDPNQPSPTATLDDAASLRIRIVLWFKGRDELAGISGAERLNLLLLDRLRAADVAFR